MLLQNKYNEKPDYLLDWPSHYYDIPSGTKRMEFLDSAKKLGISSPADPYRIKLCKKRFFSQNKSGTVDSFMHAWMMIKASSAAGCSFLQKRRLTRELEKYMEDLCLLHYEPENDEELMVLNEEWSDFARYFILSCIGNKNYCSTLFGLVPIKDATVAEKIAAEIQLVTRDYPSCFGYEEEFMPLNRILRDTYCNIIEGGADYLT